MQCYVTSLILIRMKFDREVNYKQTFKTLRKNLISAFLSQDVTHDIERSKERVHCFELEGWMLK